MWRRGSHTEARKLGNWGERQAARLLKRKGLKILGRQVRLGPQDEIDIVARTRETLVFVEVKTRRHEEGSRPLDAVDRTKRKALTRAAFRYLRRLPDKPPCIRFDVVEVIGAPRSGAPILRHVEEAFALAPAYRYRPQPMEEP